MDTIDIYGSLSAENDSKVDIKKRSDLRRIYFNFFNDFREYLISFIRESLSELVIGEIPISAEPVKIFEENGAGRYITVKNQGDIVCFINTQGRGGFRLDAGEKEKFWVNKSVFAVTISGSGSTTLGIIKS